MAALIGVFPLEVALRDRRCAMAARILVATDCSPQAEGALHVARALAEGKGFEVEVASVLEPIPLFGATAAELVANTRREREEVGMQSVYRRIAETLAELGPAAHDWPVRVEVGTPPPTIVRLAEEAQADLILLGHGRHAIAERWFGNETALKVMRLSHLPVLAVPAEMRALPRRALFAVDFTEWSVDAALAAIRLMPAEAEVHLAHVLWTPSDTLWVGGVDWITERRDRLAEQLDTLRRRIGEATGAAVIAHMLDGDPALQLLRLAERIGAELIAAGSHGAGFFGRILMGSVSTRLVRRATCAVLVNPPPVVPEEVRRVWEAQKAAAQMESGVLG
jgi:nucleotide-binding universal stress UspA family protein